MADDKIVSKVWTFKSDSNPNKSYEALRYTSGSTSCNCPGWTRRVASDGSRTCKHTRMIDQGIADSCCDASHEYESGAKATTPAATAKATKTPKSKMTTQATRKIQWQ